MNRLALLASFCCFLYAFLTTATVVPSYVNYHPVVELGLAALVLSFFLDPKQ